MLYIFPLLLYLTYIFLLIFISQLPIPPIFDIYFFAYFHFSTSTPLRLIQLLPGKLSFMEDRNPLPNPVSLPVPDSDDDNSSMDGLYSSGDDDVANSNQNSCIQLPDRPLTYIEMQLIHRDNRCPPLCSDDPESLFRELRGLVIEELPLINLIVTFYHRQVPNVGTERVEYMGYRHTVRFLFLEGYCYVKHMGCLWEIEDLHSDYQWLRATYVPICQKNQKGKKRCLTMTTEKYIIFPKPRVVRYLRALLPQNTKDLIPYILKASFPIGFDKCFSCHEVGLQVGTYRCRQCNQWWCWKCKMDLPLLHSPEVRKERGYYLKCTEHVRHQLQ